MMNSLVVVAVVVLVAVVVVDVSVHIADLQRVMGGGKYELRKQKRKPKNRISPFSMALLVSTLIS